MVSLSEEGKLCCNYKYQLEITRNLFSNDDFVSLIFDRIFNNEVLLL